MSRRSIRPGLTRLQVLVVVVLIGVLAYLALPAIQYSREAARRAECGNYLRSIATGLQSYHDTHKVFPMGAMHSGPNPGGDPPITAGLGPSWWFGIVPFMDQQGVYNTIHDSPPPRAMRVLMFVDRRMYDKILESQNVSQGVRCEFCADDIDRYVAAHPYTDSQSLRVAGSSLACMYPEYMTCPASPLPWSETSAGPIALPRYVGIAGGCDIDPRSEDYQISGGAPPGLVAPQTEQVYRNKYKGTGVAEGGIVTSSGLLPPCQHVKLQDCTDGASHTMIVAEQSDWLRDRNPALSTKYHGDPGWTDSGGNHLSGRDTGSGGGWLSGTRRVDPVPQVNTPGGPPADWGGDCWNVTTVRYQPNLKRVMGANPLPGCSENHGINNPLQSPHPGGLWVAWADGSVQFISETAAVEILLRLAIRDDGVTPPLASRTK